MDDFKPYGDTFEQALTNLDKVMQICIEMIFFSRNDKSMMLCDQCIVLGHHISNKGIQVDPAKVNVIVNLPRP